MHEAVVLHGEDGVRQQRHHVAHFGQRELHGGHRQVAHGGLLAECVAARRGAGDASSQRARLARGARDRQRRESKRRGHRGGGWSRGGSTSSSHSGLCAGGGGAGCVGLRVGLQLGVEERASADVPAPAAAAAADNRVRTAHRHGVGWRDGVRRKGWWSELREGRGGGRREERRGEEGRGLRQEHEFTCKTKTRERGGAKAGECDCKAEPRRLRRRGRYSTSHTTHMSNNEATNRRKATTPLAEWTRGAGAESDVRQDTGTGTADRRATVRRDGKESSREGDEENRGQGTHWRREANTTNRERETHGDSEPHDQSTARIQPRAAACSCRKRRVPTVYAPHCVVRVQVHVP